MTAPGAYGIEAVDPSTPGALVCGSCGRAWTEDITPSGRCPWEHLHHDHQSDDATEDLYEEARRYARQQAEAGITDILDAIADAYFAGASR